ncbi:hypothetical protein GW17_00054825, partial [Ensete ventricosum]
ELEGAASLHDGEDDDNNEGDDGRRVTATIQPESRKAESEKDRSIKDKRGTPVDGELVLAYVFLGHESICHRHQKASDDQSGSEAARLHRRPELLPQLHPVGGRSASYHGIFFQEETQSTSSGICGV